MVAASLAELLLDVWLGGYTAVELVGFVAANTVEPLVGATLARHFISQAPNLARTRELLVFLVCGGGLGPVVGAAIGAGTVVSRNESPGFGSVFFQWWLGDGLGAVLVGSVIVTAYATTADRRELRSLEGTALLVLTTVAAFVIYWTTTLDVGLILLVAAITAGVRFGSKAVSVISLLVATIAFLSLPGTGELIAGLANNDALLVIKLQFFAFAIAGLVVAAEAAERDLVTEQVTVQRKSVSDLQRALLPPAHLAGEHFDAEGCYRAADTQLDVGGDWYDITQTADGLVAISIGDVVGHGGTAVTAMGQLRFAMAGLTAAGLSPCEALSELDQRARELSGAFAASVWVAQFDPEQATLTYSAAGLPPPLLRTTDQGWLWLDQARGTPIGVAKPGSRAEHTIELESGTLVAYTDGAVERRGESIDEGLERLRAILSESEDLTLAGIIDAVTSRDSFDDTVMVRIDLRAQTPPPRAHLSNSARPDGDRLPPDSRGQACEPSPTPGDGTGAGRLVERHQLSGD